jgi:hypothetical protein
MSNQLLTNAGEFLMGIFRSFTNRMRQAVAWLKSPFDILFVCYALLMLYALPLIVILFAFVSSDWFTKSSALISFSMSLASLYASNVRETLGTFIVPFVTAYAVAGVQKGNRLEARTLWLFVTLIGLFLMSIVVYSAIQTKVDTMLGQTSVPKPDRLAAKNQFLSMSASYVKELLVYISLLIGISHAGRAGEGK